MLRAFLLAFSFSIAAGAAVPRACVSVVKACRAGGFVPGKTNKHPGQGIWADCVRPLAKGKAVRGVKGVSKKAAQACLTARHPKRKGKS
jgi:hypothetical protein